MAGRIDVHHHFMSQAYLDAVGIERAASPGSAGHVDPWTAELSLEFMDAAGIGSAVLSVSAPGIDLGTPQATAKLARECNEAKARMVADRPRRFGMLAILPLPDIDLSLSELTHALDVLGADGVVLMSNYDGDYLGHERFAPLFAELDRRAAVTFVHPTAPLGYRGFPGVSLSTLEFPFDTARTMASLLHAGTPERFANVTFVFSHAGGAMPYLAGRTAVLSRRNREFRLSGEKLVPAMGRFYYDLTQSLNAATFATLRALVPFDRLLFGSDCPFARAPQIEAAIAELDTLPLSAAERAALERGNAQRLFPRFA